MAARKRARRKSRAAAADSSSTAAAPESPTSTASSSAEQLGPGPEAGVAPPAPPDEIAGAIAQIRAEAPEGAPGGAAGAPQLEHEDAGEALLNRAEKIAGGDMSELEGLTADEIADFFVFVYGSIAAFRGPHWELEDKAAARLGHWVKRSIDRHGWQWLAKWAPDIMAAMLLLWETGKRWRIDAELKKQRELEAPAA